MRDEGAEMEEKRAEATPRNEARGDLTLDPVLPSFRH